MNKNIHSVTHKKKSSSPFVKNYFSLLKEFEAKKDKILPPTNKANEPKKPQLIEEIYNKYSAKLGNYYMKNRNNICLYGSKKFEKLTIEALMDEMRCYKETILKQIKDNPKLIYSVRNFPEESNDEKMILTPMPDTQRKKIKSNREKREFNNAERTAVVMRIVEYTHRLKKRDENNKEQNNKNDIRNSEEDNIKVAFAMKKAVDTIERCWINSKRNSKKALINKKIEQKGIYDNYESKRNQYNELDIWKALLLLKKYIDKKIFNRIKEYSVLRYRNKLLNERTIQNINDMNFCVDKCKKVKINELRCKENRMTLFFITKIIYSVEYYKYRLDSIQKIQKEYRKYLVKKTNELKKKPKMKVVPKNRTSNSPKRKTYIPIIGPVGHFITKQSFQIHYLKLIQNKYLQYYYIHKAKKDSKGGKIYHKCITSNTITTQAPNYEITSFGYSSPLSNENKQIELPIELIKIEPSIITKKIKCYSERPIIIPTFTEACMLTKIFKINKTSNDDKLNIKKSNKVVREINVDIEKNKKIIQSCVVKEINFNVKQFNTKNIDMLYKAIMRKYFIETISQIKQYNETLIQKGVAAYLVYEKYNIKTYFNKWYFSTHTLFLYSKTIKRKSTNKSNIRKFNKKVKIAKIKNRNNSPLYQLSFAILKLIHIIKRKPYESIINYTQYKKIAKFNNYLLIKYKKELLYRLVLNSLSSQRININKKDVLDLLKFGDNKSNKYLNRLNNVLRLNLTNNNTYQNSNLPFPVYVKKLIGDRDKKVNSSHQKSSCESIDTEEEFSSLGQKGKSKIPDDVNRNFICRNLNSHNNTIDTTIKATPIKSKGKNVISDNIFEGLNTNRKIQNNKPITNRNPDIKGKDMVKITESIINENDCSKIDHNYLYEDDIKLKPSKSTDMLSMPDSNRIRKTFWKRSPKKEIINLRDETVFDCPA